ncbi:tetratricopeptide repeat protein [Leptolyngbya sp. 15MV]|nr:tetratricopeptide repeat protein [Leptolyngbya sp. 15MV]
MISLALARSIRSERAAEELARLQELEANRAESIADFLRRMLTGISPAAARGKDTTLLRGILDDAAKAVDDPSLDVPVRAALHDILGEAYRSIGKLPEAEHHLTQALSLRTQEDPDSAATAMAAGNLGSFYRSELERPDLAAPHLEHAYRALLALRGAGESNTISARNNLALLYMTMGRFQDAQTLLEEQLSILTGSLGRSHETTARVLSNLASIDDLLDREPMAATLMREAYDLRTARLGESHPEPLAPRVNFGSYHLKRGRLADAEPLLEGAHQILLDVAGPDHPRTLAAAGHLARLRVKQGRAADAIELLDNAIQRGSKVLGPDHSNISGWRLARAQALQALGQSTLAADEAALAIKDSRQQYPPTSWLLASRLLEYGELLLDQDNSDAAEPLLREALSPLTTALGPRGHATKRCAALLARIAEATGRIDEAAQLRAGAGLDGGPHSTPAKPAVPR